MKKILFATAALLAAFSPAAAKPLYHEIATIALGAPDKWDYLHAEPGRLYVSHGDEVTVIDTATDKVIGQLTNLPGSHGIAIDPATGDVLADSAGRSVAVAFDPKTFAPLWNVPVALDADGMVYDPASKKIFNTGGDGHAITPIEPATKTALPTIPLPGAPEFLGADGRGNLYDNITDLSEIVRIDTATDAITATWPLTPCEHPKGLAVDSEHDTVYASCANGILVALNGKTGAIIAHFPIARRTDAAAYDPVRHRIFSSNGDGTLTVISTKTATPVLLATIQTAPGARTLAVDPATGRIYLVTADISGTTPPTEPGALPRFTFVPGTVKVLVFAP
jgi:DNA-binding beta-propeller fold protein YncE